MSGLRAVTRQIKQAGDTASEYAKNKLHRFLDNLDDHFDTVVKGVVDEDNFDGAPGSPNKPDTHRPGDGDNRPYLKPGSRPSLRKSTILKVWEMAKWPDGKVREPYFPFGVIEWTPGTPRRGVWDMGHVPEEKYHETWLRYVNGEMTPKQFRDWYNDPDNYRPELPGPNRGHTRE